MAPSNAPTTAYYSTLHDSITSLCKRIIPLGINKRCRLVSAEHKLWKLRSENLKWQQDTFHQLRNLMGLYRDDILPEAEVSAFRSHLIHTLLASPNPQQDHPVIIRDKLGFLQELLDAKCISEGEFHSSRRPLLNRLSVQGGGDIGGRDVTMVAGSQDAELNSEEEWSVIDLKDEQCLMNKENSNSKKKTWKNIKGATSVFSFGSSNKHGKNSKEKSIFDSPYLQMHSAHSKVPSSTNCDNTLGDDGAEKLKRKPFRILLHREKKEGHGGGDQVREPERMAGTSAKKQWGFKGFEKLRRNDSDDDTAPLHSDVSPYDFSISDKVSEDNINKEVPIIQTELRSTNTNAVLSNDGMQANPTKLPENKAELKNHFPKSLCDRYGGVASDVVKKEFKNYVGEKENMRKDAEEKHESTMGWTTFEDDENLHPNLFAHQDNSLRSSSINPFSHGYAESNWN